MNSQLAPERWKNVMRKICEVTSLTFNVAGTFRELLFDSQNVSHERWLRTPQ